MLAEAKEPQMRECLKTASYDAEFYEGDAAALRTAVQLVSSYLPPKDGVPAELRAILMEMIDNDGGKGSSRWDSLRAGNARDPLFDGYPESGVGSGSLGLCSYHFQRMDFGVGRLSGCARVKVGFQCGFAQGAE